MAIQRAESRSAGTSNLADLLERVLDKGIVIAGDIKLSLGEVELLSLQIRLIICSVDKAREIGLDWWVNNPAFSSQANSLSGREGLARIEQRLEKIEGSLAGKSPESKKRRTRPVKAPVQASREG